MSAVVGLLSPRIQEALGRRNELLLESANWAFQYSISFVESSEGPVRFVEWPLAFQVTNASSHTVTILSFEVAPPAVPWLGSRWQLKPVLLPEGHRQLARVYEDGTAFMDVKLSERRDTVELIDESGKLELRDPRFERQLPIALAPGESKYLEMRFRLEVFRGGERVSLGSTVADSALLRLVGLKPEPDGIYRCSWRNVPLIATLASDRKHQQSPEMFIGPVGCSMLLPGVWDPKDPQDTLS